MLLNIWVRDNCDGEIHQVGTDVHDSLIFVDGKIEYYNLQNGDGTPDGYSFIDPPDMDDYANVTPDELFINKKLIHNDFKKAIEKSFDFWFNNENCEEGEADDD